MSVLVELKALLFDLGGTLDSDGAPWKERFYELHRDFGLEVPREQFFKAYYAADDRSDLADSIPPDASTAPDWIRVLKP